ncbi:methyltransferase domain-containing protein [Arhodomonas sp. AD133]|uniref:class I SAM-dependent methyltransferase n=1 Tax=Arhodomonas sp. AD133 TaxID=3415009 RepID=UPI003EBB049B
MDRILTLGELHGHELDNLQESGVEAICALPAPEARASTEVNVRWLDAATPTSAGTNGIHRPEFRPAFTKLLLDARPQLVHVNRPEGWAFDLIRTAALLGHPVTVDLHAFDESVLDQETGTLVADALSYANALIRAPHPVVETVARLTGRPAAATWNTPSADMHSLFQRFARSPQREGATYADYEFGLRDQGLIEAMQRPHLRYFNDCHRVLDVASGPGVFLGLLAASGIPGEGVERNAAAVRYARGLGYIVHEADAVTYLEQCREEYDGLYCSHFIEHLPVADAERLVYGAYQALRDGGTAVFVFPDPESIRSQLLGFWRDPEHVRFYHPELVALMARGAGFQVLEGGEGRGVAAFPEECPLPKESPARVSRPRTQPSDVTPEDDSYRSVWRNILRRLGILPGRDAVAHQQALARRLSALESEVEALRERERGARQAIHALWSINRTWAWDDNACLVLHKSTRD